MSTCKACREELVFRAEDSGDDIDGGDVVEVPDDLELSCGCHFHWQCLLDESSSIALSLKCPCCGAYLSTSLAGPSTTDNLPSPPAAAIRVNYRNEGGFQSGLDILPEIIEEAYLVDHPETRRARAFQTMCCEGDVNGMIELLAAMEGDEDTSFDVASVIQYQDPLSDMKSGLHVAVEQGQVEVALLLLWLCSTVASESFPDTARRVAVASGVGRLPVGPDGDIRRLKDSSGLTAENIARQLQGPWLGYLDAGLL